MKSNVKCFGIGLQCLPAAAEYASAGHPQKYPAPPLPSSSSDSRTTAGFAWLLPACSTKLWLLVHTVDEYRSSRSARMSTADSWQVSKPIPSAIYATTTLAMDREKSSAIAGAISEVSIAV